MFSLEGQPGCKWLYIDRREESHRHGQAKASALGENPVGMNNVHMSERGYNIDNQECGIEYSVYSACRYQIRGMAMSPTHGQGMGKEGNPPTF